MTDGSEGPTATRRGGTRLLPWGLAGLLAIGISVAVFSGGYTHRSVAEMAEVVPIGQGIDTVRLEIQNGTVGFDLLEPGKTERVVAYAGGVRRGAPSAEGLAQLEALPLALAVVTDPARPSVLVLRGPIVSADEPLLFAHELGIRLPGDLRLEVVVTGSGHLTLANRAGHTEIETGRGDLRFERCKGAVRAKTGRGNVIAFDHEGDLDLRTAVGDMQAFVRRPGVLLRLVTGQGTVQCGVPPDCEFELDARAEIGRIGADFGLVGEAVGSYGAALVGRRGAGQTKVVLRTGSGHLAFKEHKFR